jgi:hypothetical protein
VSVSGQRDKTAGECGVVVNVSGQRDRLLESAVW